jgi:hypothetical protein
VDNFAFRDMNYTLIIHKFRQSRDLMFQNLGRLTGNNIPIYYMVIQVDNGMEHVVRHEGRSADHCCILAQWMGCCAHLCVRVVDQGLRLHSQWVHFQHGVETTG